MVHSRTVFVDTRPVDAIAFHHDPLGADDPKFFRISAKDRSHRFCGQHGVSGEVVPKSTYEMLGHGRRFTTLELVAELLGPNQDARRDAYECIDRVADIFSNGQGEWVGYPSGASRTDNPQATDM